MTSIAVAIMAKQPVPGAVKTRLRPLLSDSDIAALYDGFLRDRISQVRSLHNAHSGHRILAGGKPSLFCATSARFSAATAGW